LHQNSHAAIVPQLLQPQRHPNQCQQPQTDDHGGTEHLGADVGVPKPFFDKTFSLNDFEMID
jgi:hypothetical protein